MTVSTAADTVVVLNPNSGSGTHGDDVRERAAEHGYDVEETTEAGEASAIAAAAAEAGVETIVAAGGDGTVNEVIQGIDRADAFEDVTLGVVPVGTGNNFAKNIGVTDLDAAFDVVEAGERRRIDLGYAEGRPFVNSCVAGLTAESSSETSPELKNRFGVLAYVITTLQSVQDFEALRLSVDVEEAGTEEPAWSGDAMIVLVGNGRRFTAGGGSQANMEDGLLDVTVIEDVSALDLMSETVVEQLLGRESPAIVRFQAPSLTLTVHNPTSVRFSLDGEVVQKRRLAVDVRRRPLEVAVGEEYDPDPDGDAG